MSRDSVDRLPTRRGWRFFVELAATKDDRHERGVAGERGFFAERGFSGVANERGTHKRGFTRYTGFKRAVMLGEAVMPRGTDNGTAWFRTKRLSDGTDFGVARFYADRAAEHYRVRLRNVKRRYNARTEHAAGLTSVTTWPARCTAVRFKHGNIGAAD